VTRLLPPPAPGWGAAALLLALLSGCSGPARTPPEPPGTEPSEGPGQQAPEAQPREVPLSPYGNPASYEIAGETYYPMGRDEAEGLTQRGHASWYGEKFHGRRTSSGERYDMYAMTAAHRELPLPSWVEVTNLQNGRSAVVKVNDRGPFVDTHERILDLSYAAASRLGIAEQGTAPVEIRVITPEGTSSEAAEAAGETAEAGGAEATAATARGQRERAGDHPEGPAPTGASAAPEAGDGASAEAAGALAVSDVQRVIAEAGDQEPPPIYLQAGAYRDHANAVQVQARAEALEAEAEIQAIRDGEGLLHRVRLGPLVDPAEIERIEAALEEAGIETYRVGR